MRLIVRALVAGIVVAVIGGAIGYGIFGKVMGEYVDLDLIFSPKNNFLEAAARKVTGLNAMRTKIIGCALAGGALGSWGYVIAALKGGR